MCYILFLVTTTVPGNNNTCCFLASTLPIVCYDLQGSRYTHTVCLRVKYQSCCCLGLMFRNPTTGVQQKKKGIHIQLIIISDFSRACPAGKGPPTSHLTAGGAFVGESITLVFYSWLWNLFQLSQITLLLSHYRALLYHIHRPTLRRVINPACCVQ